VLTDLFRLPADQVDRMMADAIDDKTAEVAAGAPIVEVPGAAAFVQSAIGAGFRTALVSSASAVNVTLALAALGLDGSFELVIDAGRVARGKPAPDPYLLAASRLGVVPLEMIVFEDSVAGVASALAAGAACVAIASTERPERLSAADLVIDGWAAWTPQGIVAAVSGAARATAARRSPSLTRDAPAPSAGPRAPRSPGTSRDADPAGRRPTEPANQGAGAPAR
jgi:beta-phosphoglucomutase-like phosphatase (HAD superfamily)